MPVLEQTVIFLLIILIGIYARKQGMITPDNQSQISAIVVNIAYPAIILSGVLSENSKLDTHDLILAFLSSVILLALALLLGYITAILLKFEKSLRGIVQVLTVFTNIGFMGVPMIDNIYGKSALIYMSVFLIPFNILFYSFAIKTIKRESLNPFSGFKLKELLNNGMIACFLAVFIYLSGIKLPYFIGTTVHLLGSMTAPLAMLLIGSFLSDINLKSLFTEPKIIVYTLIKMLIIPLIIIKLLGLYINDNLLLAVCMAALATPCGNVIALLTSIYNKQAYPVAVKTITLSTILSVITMPLAFYLGGIK